MGHLLAAPDKFRGTATAFEAAVAAARGARRAGWTASQLPLADGGDGLLEVFGGDAKHDEVTGPLGAPVVAEWRLVPARPGEEGPTAVIEMARASGLAVVGGAVNNRAVEASTVGTGELIVIALQQGATRIVVGCGGSATTDGGAGALSAIGSPGALAGVDLVAACDVTTRFLDAAREFAPQKGASADQVAELKVRLAALAERYKDDWGFDVTGLIGGGAAGGLAGGLAVYGARIVPGFDLVAEALGLDEQLVPAGVVMTGEGYLDRQSFAGKVVGGVVRRVAGRAGGPVPILCIVGDAAPGAGPPTDAGPAASTGIVPFELVSLVNRYGPDKARTDVLGLIEEVVAEYLAGRPE